MHYKTSSLKTHAFFSIAIKIVLFANVHEIRRNCVYTANCNDLVSCFEISSFSDVFYVYFFYLMVVSVMCFINAPLYCGVKIKNVGLEIGPLMISDHPYKNSLLVPRIYEYFFSFETISSHKIHFFSSDQTASSGEQLPKSWRWSRTYLWTGAPQEPSLDTLSCSCNTRCTWRFISSRRSLSQRWFTTRRTRHLWKP